MKSVLNTHWKDWCWNWICNTLVTWCEQLTHCKRPGCWERLRAWAHWVGDAIQPSHPLSPPSSSALNLSQHQGLFQWVSSSHQVARVLELQLQLQLHHQSFQWIFRVDFLKDWLVWSPYCPRDSQEFSPASNLKAKGLSRVFSSVTTWKHQFLCTQPSLQCNSHIHTRLLEKSCLTSWTFISKVASLPF